VAAIARRDEEGATPEEVDKVEQLKNAYREERGVPR
jgi:hypothetical protein